MSATVVPGARPVRQAARASTAMAIAGTSIDLGAHGAGIISCTPSDSLPLGAWYYWIVGTVPGRSGKATAKLTRSAQVLSCLADRRRGFGRSE